MSVNSSNKVNHQTDEPQFEEVVVFYNFVFDLGTFLNPTEAARKLLDKEFALSAANYLTDDIEVATRFKRLTQLRSNAQDISEILEKPGMLDIAGWAITHPIRSFRLLKTILQTRLAQRKKSLDHTEDQTKDEDIQAELKGVKSFIDEAMVRIQLFEALQRDSDRLLFSPLYLREIPFARVGLQPFYATVAGERIDADVSVLIHRTGVAILTFYVVFDGRRSADELINLQTATRLKVESSEVVRAIVEPGARAFGLRSPDLDRAPFERQSSSGVEWFIYRDQEGVTLADIFELYQTAIISAIHRKEPSKPSEPWSWLRTPDWFAYPIVFIRRIIPAVPNDSAFKSRYPGVLAGLVWRFPHWQTMKEEKVREVIKADFSLSEDYSLYVEASHATVLYYEPYRQALIEKYGDDIPGQEWIFAYLQTSGVIDVLLIQRWILTVLSQQFSSLSYNLNRLNTLRQDLLLALEEYHGITLSYGSAQEIIQKAKDIMGINELYQGVMVKLSGIEKLIEAEETRRSARREFLVKAGAIIATLLFGLSGAWEVTKVAQEWNQLPQESWWGLDRTVLKPIVEFVQSHPIPFTLLLYVILLGVVTLMIAWSVLAPRRRGTIYETDKSRPAYIPRFTWPVGVKIAHEEQANDPEEIDVAPKA